jgi:hypothetical protein
MKGLKCSVKLGKSRSPTPAMVEKVINSNLTAYQKEWMGIVAHEIGHLLGAGEVSLLMGQSLEFFGNLFDQ